MTWNMHCATTQGPIAGQLYGKGSEPWEDALYGEVVTHLSKVMKRTGQQAITIMRNGSSDRMVIPVGRVTHVAIGW